MTLIETLKQLGIEDISVLPGKTQRKLKDYDKLMKSPVARNSKTGEFHPGTKQRLDDLCEDIILEAKVFLKQQNLPDPEEEKRRAAAEAAAEEAKRKAAEEEARKKAEEGKKKSTGFVDWLFGE